MDISKARSSTVLDGVLRPTVVAKEPGMNVRENDGDNVPPNSPNQAATPGREITIDDLNIYLRRVSATSTDEIDALVRELQVLREKLLGDGNRIEQDMVEFVSLGSSVIKLTGIISDSVARMKTAGRLNKNATSATSAPAAALSSSSGR